jgi:hypothetical protein
MLTFLLGVLVIVAVVVFPVMIAARVVNAGKTGFGSALLAVILQVCLSAILNRFISNEVIGLVVGLALGAAVYAMVLDTTMLKGFIISILTTVIMVAAVFLLAGTFMAFAG